MLLDRPTTREMDALADLGNPGWDAASLIPYMNETERNHRQFTISPHRKGPMRTLTRLVSSSD